LVPGVEKSDAEFEWICVLSTATFFAKVVRSPIKEIEQKVTMTTKKEWFNDKPSARLRKFSFPFSVFSFQFSVFGFWDFGISSPPIRVIRLIRGSQSSHFLNRV